MKKVTIFTIILSAILIFVFGIIPWTFDISLSSKIFGTIVCSVTAVIVLALVYNISKTLK